jgi:hypothetical protein
MSFVKYHVMETNEEVAEYLHAFITLALDGDLCNSSECRSFTSVTGLSGKVACF